MLRVFCPKCAVKRDIELPVAIHDVREVSVLSIFIFFLYDNYCILFSVFLYLVLFIPRSLLAFLCSSEKKRKK